MKNFKRTMFYIGLFVLAFILGFVVSDVRKTLMIQVPETYYLEAEILSQENGETVFCTEKGNFKVHDKELNPDTEYLLTMLSNGTKTPKDDEICVIWEVK